MTNEVVFGIDLGTSTSEIFFKTAKGNLMQVNNSEGGSLNPIFHSMVALNNHNEIVSGEAAYDLIGDKSRCIAEFKRDMGELEKTYTLNDKLISPTEASAIVLKMLKKKVKDTYGFDVKKACISIPANFPNVARENTIRAAKLAEIEEIELINEPTAAALAYGFDKANLEEQVMVFDWGGGTLDVTILQIFHGVLEVITSYGDPRLGGKDFDQLIIDFMYETFKKQHPTGEFNSSNAMLSILKKEAKKAKEKLTYQEQADILIVNFGKLEGESVNLKTTLTRDIFETIAKPLLNRASNVIEEAMNSKGVKKETIQKIIPVGGSSYIPCVRRLLMEYFELADELVNSVPPDLAVAQGATINAAIKWNLVDEEQSIIVSDVSPFGLGIEVATLMGNQLSTYYESLIEPNKTIPYSTTKKYSLMHHEQNQIRVSLYQAHRRGIRDLNDTYFTGIVGDINNIPQSMDERPHSVEVHFSYDVNGLVELTATVPETGQHLDLHANANDIKVRMSDLDKLKDILGESDNDEQNKESPSVNSFLADSLNDNVLELPRRYQKVIKKARLIVENEQDHKYHEDLSDFLEGFDAALEKNNQKKMDRYFDRIEDIILDL